jgi:hypothetical protein
MECYCKQIVDVIARFSASAFDWYLIAPSLTSFTTFYLLQLTSPDLRRYGSGQSQADLAILNCGSAGPPREITANHRFSVTTF